MNIRRLFALLITTIILTSFYSCNQDDDDTLSKHKHTHIFYFTGSYLRLPFYNNISATKQAIREGHKGDSRIILFFQPTDRKTANIIELIENNGSCEEQVLASFDIPAIMTPNDLSYYLREIIRLAPADTYSLVMGGHSTAWIPQVPISSQSTISPNSNFSHEDYWRKANSENPTRFFGEIYSDMASNSFEIDELSVALASTDVKFEYILFDACFMSNVESMYELRNTAKYLIGSPCEIMNVGFPYDRCLPYMLPTNSTYDLNKVCKVYHDYYEETKGYSGSVALVDCSQLDALAESIKNIHKGSNQSVDLETIQTYEGLNEHIFFDLGDYITSFSTNESLITAFEKQMERTVICKYTLDRFWSNYGWERSYTIDIDKFSGISTSSPSKLYREDYAQTAWYKATN